MSTVSANTAKALILLSQHTPFSGRGDYAVLGAPIGRADGPQFPQAEEELRRLEDFFAFFRSPVKEILRGRTVLDLGSGYGGRSVGYALHFEPHEIIGVEVVSRQVELSAAFARAKGADRCRFVLATQDELPLANASIDVVISYDVLEHVRNPQVTMGEIRRVLSPGGYAVLAFTPYHGMLSHHLAYVTRIPGIHWFFSPSTLVTAINEILSSPGGGRFTQHLQPMPSWSYNGKRMCLPGLNGLTSTEFRGLLNDFEILEIRQTPLLERYRVLGPLGIALNLVLMQASDRARDALSFNLACVLRRQ